MKKQKKHLVQDFVSFMPKMDSGRQFLVAVIFLALFCFLAWKYLSNYFYTETQTKSTASYEGLDVTSYGYWRERTERDIVSARLLADSPLQQNSLLINNISSTVRAACQLKDPAEKAMALSSIVTAQIAQNVSTNIDEAMQGLGYSQEVRILRMNLTASLAFFYIQTDRNRAAFIVQDYLNLLKETPFRVEDSEQRTSLVQILDACAVLNLENEMNTVLKSLTTTANMTTNEKRKNVLVSFIAEQQIRFQKYADAFETFSHLKQPDLLARCYRKLIESRAQISSANSTVGSGETSQELWNSSANKIRHPELVAQTLERVFINIGRIKDQKTQQEVLQQLFESDMMTNLDLHDLVRSVLVDTRSLDSTVKAQTLSLIDNPRSETIRQALGMPPLLAGSENGTGEMSDEQLINQAKQVLTLQPLYKNRMYLEDIRILTNTATELLSWGKKKEAILLLNHAAERIRGLDIERNQGVSRTTLAAVLVSAGEIETAQALLYEEGEILKLSQQTQQSNLDFSRIAEVQLRARLLDETFRTLREMLPSQTKTNLLQSLGQEQIKIGRYEESQKSFAEMPAGPTKTEMLRLLEETITRLHKKLHENTYSFSPLDEILRSNWADTNLRLFDLVESQIREGLLLDARETARCISDAAIHDRALDLIVQETITILRTYYSSIPLHQQVRKNMFSFGMQTAQEIGMPKNRLFALERISSQTVWIKDSNEFLPNWEEMESLWNSLSDSADSPSELTAKIDVGIRLFQNELKRIADDQLALVGGTWAVLPESSSFPSSEQKQILLKSAALTHQLNSPEERVIRFAQITALFYQIRDKESGKLHYESTVDANKSVTQKNIAANVCLSLAQTLFQAGLSDESRKMFELAVEEAEKIASENSTKKIDRLLDKRMKDRILSDIARGEAELGLIYESKDTMKKIKEKFFVDRLCKTIGYFQISQGAFEEAEKTFKNIQEPSWKNSCLNDALFRRRWGTLER